MKSIKEDLDSIFGIPKDKSNIKEESEETQEGSYIDAISKEDNEDFQSKANKINALLEKDAPLNSYVSSNKEADNVRTEQTSRREPQKDKFEEILSNSVRPNPPVSEKVQPLVQEQKSNNKNTKIEEKIEEQDEERETVTNNSSAPIHDQKIDENGWFLTAPTPMFNHFYQEKANLVFSITRGNRPLDFEKMLSELKSSYVSTKNEINDIVGMSEKLTNIQDLLDRVVQIKIKATAQCASFKRGIELLRGVLAKVSYEKPSIRQEGVVYDHMRDLEMYSSKIESLEQCAKDVYHNLLEAKEILSRKISISLELLKQQHVTDNLEKTYSALPQEVKNAVQKVSSSSKELDGEGFDRLEVQEVVKASSSSQQKPTSNKKSGVSDWLD